MFNKLNSVKSFCNTKITLDQLVTIVKDNPQKEIIEKIRSVEYKSSEYNNLKLKLNCITPHGIFNSLCNDGLIETSGYLYFDIDGFDTEIELNDTKKKLIDTYPISFLCKSVGGKGISFLIKINDTKKQLNDTFGDVYSFVRHMLIKSGFNIDVCASGLVRKMIISSDLDVYTSNKVLNIDQEQFKIYLNSLKEVKKIQRKEELYYITLDDTLIPFQELIKQIKLETEYTKEIDKDYVMEDLEYYKIIIPTKIKDGDKHRVFTRMINALYYLNPNINRLQIYSFISYINNNHTTQKMNIQRLKTYVNYICQNIETTGEIKIKLRKKKIHFNKNCNLTKKEKQSMATKLMNIKRGNETFKIIEEARMKCAQNNIVPTQKMISEITGLSIATIKRNWNKMSSEIEIEIVNTKNDVERSITEDIFFNEVDIKKENIIQPELNMKEIEYNYKGIEKVKIEITKDDLKTFKEMLNKLNNRPSEDLLLDFGWDKYKTTYLYLKWLEKNRNRYYTTETE